MRVAVTGIGLISGLGRGEADHADALRSGRSGLRALTLFTAEGIAPRPVGEVEAKHLPDEPRRSRSDRLALAAAFDAWRASRCEGLGPGIVSIGTTTGGIASSEQHYLKHKGQPGEADRELLRRHAAGTIADAVAARLELTAECHTISTACSSSANSIGHAAMQLESGAARWALAGGVDSLSLLTYAGFYSLKLLAGEACAPFDAQRRGLSLGEAAAFLVLEPVSALGSRPALGYVTGWGCSADAHHITAPEPTGAGAAAAISAALADAGVKPDAVDYVNAHGTATPANDAAETAALKRVFGEKQPWVSSTKGATGHTLGAAGALEAALSLLALRHGFLPATVGLKTPDPGLPVRHVPAGGLAVAARVAVSNSFGFGGNNAALVLEGSLSPDGERGGAR